MSTTFLSFASIAKLHDNSLLTTSPIGELSNKSNSYAKDPGKFTLAANSPSATVLVNFYSETDGTEIVMPQAIAEAQIGVSNWLYEQALSGKVTDSRPNTLALLKAQFTTSVVIEDVGEMVTNNTIWLPSFVRGYHVVGGDKQPFYLWMADAYFLIQYPRVQFTIIHPIPLNEMDDLMTMNYQQIAERFARETPTVIAQREHEATRNAGWPYTERNVEEFQILDLVNTGKFNMGYWSILSWGNGTEAEDQLYEQIQDEILKDSKYPREDWEEKIPDLFNPLEFYAIPRFDMIGIVDRTTGASSFSPIVDRETEIDIAKQYLVPTIPEDFIIKSFQTLPMLYKSIQIGFVAKKNNRQGMQKIRSIVPQYQLIPSLDPDFGSMGEATMAFIRGMEDLVAAAEVVTPFSLLPPGVTRLTRLDKVCVGKRIGKVKYVMFTRWQMIQDGIVKED